MDFSELIAAADPSIFTESIKAWVSGLNINSVIMLIMMIFMIVGAIDRIRGNKLGYGEKFEDGFNAIGGLAIAMAGVYAAAPVLSMVLGPIISPIYTAIGADASMFATTSLACDMGGYPLAMELASDPSIGNFAGLILGTMMGPTIVFTIPVALGIIKKEDRPYLGAGVLAGMITIPIGCIVGGLVMNMTPYKMDIGRILINLVPVIVIAALIVIGLWFAPGPMINGFNKFGTGVTIVITALTAIAVFEQITGIMFPVFHIMVENPADGSRGLADLRSDRHRPHRRVPHGGVDHPYLRQAPGEDRCRSGHERAGLCRHGGQPGQQHRHVQHHGRDEPEGQAAERGLRRVCRLCVRRSPGLYRRQQPRHDLPCDRGQAGGWCYRHYRGQYSGPQTAG